MPARAPAFYCGDGGNADASVSTLNVVTEGIEPPTQGFSVLCSTN